MKNRPGTLINVLCSEKNKEKIISLLFKHTTTIGIRETKMHRYGLTATLRLFARLTAKYAVKFRRAMGSHVTNMNMTILHELPKKNISLIEARKLIDGFMSKFTEKVK